MCRKRLKGLGRRLFSAGAIIIVVFLAQCSSAPDVNSSDLSDGSFRPRASSVVLSSDCIAITKFLTSDTIRSTNLVAIKQAAAAVDRATQSVSVSECPDRMKLTRLVGMLRLKFPDDPKWIEVSRQSEKLQTQFVEKSDNFKWRLPGQKGGAAGSRSTFVKRLSAMPDRAKRESLYKLFSNTRSRKWTSWGFKDLVRARIQEAKAAGFNDYVSFALARNGTEPNVINRVHEKVKEALSPNVRSWLRTTADQNAIGTLEPWDLDFLLERVWGPDLQNGLRHLTPLQATAFAGAFLKSFGWDFAAVAGTSELGALSVKLDLPLLKSDYGLLAGNFAVETYHNEVKQPIALFQHVPETSEEAIFQTFRLLALDSEMLNAFLTSSLAPHAKEVPPDLIKVKPTGPMALMLQAYRYAEIYEFEKILYQGNDGDPAEIWSSLQKEFWGVEGNSFYSAWDEDLILKSAGASGEKMLGVLIAASLLDYIYRESSTGMTPALAARLKQEWFAGGAEWPTLMLLNEFTHRLQHPTELVEKLLKR